jgi:hypothetical protein
MQFRIESSLEGDSLARVSLHGRFSGSLFQVIEIRKKLKKLNDGMSGHARVLVKSETNFETTIDSMTTLQRVVRESFDGVTEFSLPQPTLTSFPEAEGEKIFD